MSGWDEVGKKDYSSGGSGRFLTIEPDSTVTVRLLDLEPYTIKVHNVYQEVDGDFTGRTIPATPNLDDDFIEQANKRYAAERQHNIRVLKIDDAGDPEGIYILSGGVQIFRQLKEKFEKHGEEILDLDIDITRHGSGSGTSYNVGFAAFHSDVDVDKWIAKKNADESLEWDNVFPDITAEDQQRILEEAGLDPYYDPASEIAEHMTFSDAKNVEMVAGKYGPENYPPDGKTISEIAVIDRDYLEWVAENFTSNDKVAAAARVVLQNINKLGGEKKAEELTSGDDGESPFPPVEDDDTDDDSDFEGSDEWPHKMSPEHYLNRFPDGDSADLARRLMEESEDDTDEESSDTDGSKYKGLSRDELVQEVGKALNEKFDDAMDIVRTIQKYGDGKNRVKNLTDEQLIDLLEGVA